MHEMQEESEPPFSVDQTYFRITEKSVNDKNLKQAQTKEEEYHLKAIKQLKEWIRSENVIGQVEIPFEVQQKEIIQIYQKNTRQYVEQKQERIRLIKKEMLEK